MIIDQGVGNHHAQAEYLNLGFVWTWISGMAESHPIDFTVRIDRVLNGDCRIDRTDEALTRILR